MGICKTKVRFVPLCNGVLPCATRPDLPVRRVDVFCNEGDLDTWNWTHPEAPEDFDMAVPASKKQQILQSIGPALIGTWNLRALVALPRASP